MSRYSNLPRSIISLFEYIFERGSQSDQSQNSNICRQSYLLRLAAADLILRLVAAGQHDDDVVVLGRGLQISIM